MKTTLNEPNEPMPAAAHAYPLKKNLAAGRRRFSVVQLFQTSFNAVKNNEAPSGSCLVGRVVAEGATYDISSTGPDARVDHEQQRTNNTLRYCGSSGIPQVEPEGDGRHE